MAFAKPNARIKLRMAVADSTPNRALAKLGKMLLSSPTMAPTKPLIKTSSENCCQFWRNPNSGVRFKKEKI